MPHQMDENKAQSPEYTHYEILGLPVSGAGQELSAQQLKAAYRRALLQHHPDKSQAYSESKASDSKKSSIKVYTVDQISSAYAILSVPKLRSEYDTALKLRLSSFYSGSRGDEQTFRTGFDTVDLDDIEYDEIAEVWFRSCRCGDERGFLLRETDLEEAEEDCELHVGCRGCSLWLRVLFGVVEQTG
jgi:diphthamide biosynthesis protein 4